MANALTFHYSSAYHVAQTGSFFSVLNLFAKHWSETKIPRPFIAVVVSPLWGEGWNPVMLSAVVSLVWSLSADKEEKKIESNFSFSSPQHLTTSDAIHFQNYYYLKA